MSELFEPEITVLYCGRGLAEGEYLPEGIKKCDGFKVHFVMMPCSCKVETGYLVKLIEDRADGVMLVVCPKAECQFMIGSARAENRVKFAQNLIAEVGMERDRFGVIERHNLSAENYLSIARDHADTVMPLGPNPMKAEKRGAAVG